MDQLETRRCQRGLERLDQAREARHDLRLADQLTIAAQARHLLRVPQSQARAALYATALEEEVDALLTLRRIPEACAVAFAEHDLPRGYARYRGERVRWTAAEAAGHGAEAIKHLTALADKLDSHGATAEEERLRVLCQIIITAAHGHADVSTRAVLDYFRPQARVAAAQLEDVCPVQVAYLRHRLGISESVCPSADLTAGASADLAAWELTWSQDHRPATVRDAATRDLGRGELLVVDGRRDDAAELFTKTLTRVREALPRHYASATRLLSARGLLDSAPALGTP